nr:SpaA isopeptide-forming pilin-related protein [Clostridium sp. Cult3]
MEILLKNGNGDLIATVNIDINNNVTIQFDDNVNTKGLYDRSGYFWVYSEFDAENVGEGGETDIVFDLGGGSSETITVEFEKEEETANINLVKSGEYDEEENIITWKIQVKPETTPKGKTIENVVISDKIQEGQNYIEDSATISPEVEGRFEFKDGILTYVFNEPINDGEGYNITFKTKPNIEEILKGAKNKETIYFKNKAEAIFNKDGKSVSNEASIEYVKIDYVTKSGRYIKGDESRKNDRIEWTIIVNKNKFNIKNAEIVDTIPQWLELDKSTVKLEPNIDGANYELTGNYKEGPTTLTYKLGDINENYTLTYETIIKDPNHYKGNTVKTYKNKVEFTGDNGVKGSAEKGVDVGKSKGLISKSGAGYNPSTQEITWKIVVNTNEINIINAVVTDDIPLGQEYVVGSFKVDGNVLTSGFSYVKAAEGDKDKTGTWTYKFGDINGTHTITFKTKVTDKNIWANNKTETLYNTVKLTGDNINPSPDKGSQSVSSQVIKKTGIGYDYLAREASWKIVINQNKMPMNNVVVTDVIGEYQEFVENSVVVTGSSKDKAEVNFNKETKTLTVEFTGEINNIHTIEFKTKIVDESIFHTNGDKELENTATVKSKETPESGVSATAKNKIKNTVISKKGNYKNGDNFIDWEVVINQNQLPISNVILEDTLQEGLELDTSSVELFKLVVDKDGKYNEGEEVTLNASNIKYNGETRKFEFHFTENIEEAYILKFRTDIADSHKDATFTNTINFKGSSRTETGTSENIKVKFQIGGGGATGSSRGSIKLIKVDENDNSMKLKGAIFELLDTFGNVLKTSEATGENGEALFKGLKFDTTYYIREKEAPEGYAISKEVYGFQVKDENDKKDITYSFKNTKIKGNIEFTKYGENQELLEGAEFTLYNKDDNNFEYPIKTVSSDKDGKVRFENIAFGSYKIKETKAPEGYLPSEEILYATINEDGATVKANPDSISNTMIRGNFKLKKIRKNTDTLLSGAKISVYKEDGTFMAEQITGDDGYAEFENLPYGKYYFKETKAPSGYYRNNEKHYFNIEENGVIVYETLENIKIPPYEPPTEDPYDPKPEYPKPEDPKPEEPKDPEKPEDPETKDPIDPTDPEDPTTEIDGEVPSGGTDVDKEDEDDPLIGLEDNTPKGGTGVEKTETLPKTGENDKIIFYFTGLILITFGFVFRRKTA